MIIGSHVSFSKNGLIGCINETLSYGGNAFMFYTGAPQNTIRKEISNESIIEGKKYLEENNIDINNVVVHAPYIINLATNKKENYEFSIEFLQKEIDRCRSLGVKFMVLHPGNAVGITREEGLDNLINALKILCNEDVMIIIETMAGKGTEICRNLDELEYVFNRLDNYNLGVTLDTCHMHDSGINIAKFDDYLNEFDKKIGIDKIKCIHVNDSKNELGAGKDRHENFGYGKIGYDALISVCYNERLKDVPKILETPYIKLEKTSLAPYKYEIKMIKDKKFNENLIENIINNDDI